jgi:hypothetical protein
VNRRRKRPARRQATPKAAPQPTGRALSWWRNLGRGPKWLVVTLTPLIFATAIPGIVPWAADRMRDLFGEQPLTARGEDYPELIAGQYWATDDVLTEPLANFNGLTTVREHVSAQMGVSGQQITLTSNRAGQIDIVKITAVVEQRRPPLAGTAFIADPQGEADVGLIEFHLDSGAEIPALVPDESDDPVKAATPYLANGKIRYVEQGKPDHLVIRAFTKQCYCQWRVRIEYSYRGSRGQLVVPPPGEKPFATTAWTTHKVEYNMNYADADGAPQRHDCVMTPASCRVGH